MGETVGKLIAIGPDMVLFYIEDGGAKYLLRYAMSIWQDLNLRNTNGICIRLMDTEHGTQGVCDSIP